MDKLKRILAVILIVFIFTVLISDYGNANDYISVKVDGKFLNFDFVQPSMMKGKPVVPLKSVLEALGVKVTLDDNKRSISGVNEDIRITVTVGKYYAYVNDKKIKLDIPPVRINGVIMGTTQILREALNAKIDWDEINKRLNIYSINELKVHYIDVDNGDAIFIDYGDYDILIDTGAKDKGKLVAEYLRNLDTDDIEILVITNFNDEHIGGLSEVLKEFRVDTLIHSGIKSISTIINDYETGLAEGTSMEIIRDRDLTYDLGNGALFHIIETGDNYKNDNNNSVISLLEHNNVKLLFTGDIESDAIADNLNKFSDVDILKVGNHGSEVSTSQEFLDITKPEAAIISASNTVENSDFYQKTIELLEENNIDTHNTWDDGSIIVNTDGFNYSVDNNKIIGIEIIGISFIDKKILLKSINTKDYDLSGCIVTNKKGDKIYKIPEGSTLKAGGYSIYDLEESTETNGDNESEPVEKYSDDVENEPGILYDSKWHIITIKE